jgi:arylsulfatase A-like enzyme
MDFAVGKIVQSLKDNHMYQNAVVILSSDNGGELPG